MAYQVNATIQLRVSRLNFPLPTIFARQLHSIVAVIVDIPADVYSVVLRIYRVGQGGYFDIPVGIGDDGRGRAYAVGTCFTATGATYYEIHGYDGNGNPTALGRGEIYVEPFGGTGSPIEPGQPVPVTQIADASGALHTISAVPDGEGNYTTILDAEAN